MLKYSTVPSLILPIASASIEHLSNSNGFNIGPRIMTLIDKGLSEMPANGSVFIKTENITIDEDNVLFFVIEGYYINSPIGHKGFCITRIREVDIDTFLDIKLLSN